MSANPQVVTMDATFVWDGVTQRLPRGTVLDVAPNSPLMAAIGAQRLRPLGAVAAQPPAEEEAAPQEAKDEGEQAGKAPEEPAATARKTPTKTKAQDSDDKDGES